MKLFHVILASFRPGSASSHNMTLIKNEEQIFYLERRTAFSSSAGAGRMEYGGPLTDNVVLASAQRVLVL